MMLIIFLFLSLLTIFVDAVDDNEITNENYHYCGNDAELITPLLSSAGYSFLSDSISPRLPDRNLQWKISEYHYFLSNRDIDEAATRAMKMWSDVCNLDFTQVWHSLPDIELSFQSPSSHDQVCDMSFGSYTAAHYVIGTINPKKIHFNTGLNWTTNDLALLIAHEIGHTLGIGHSKDRDSIMYPGLISNWPTVSELSTGDISVCVEKYSRRDSFSVPDSLFVSSLSDPHPWFVQVFELRKKSVQSGSE